MLTLRTGTDSASSHTHTGAWRELQLDAWTTSQSKQDKTGGGCVSLHVTGTRSERSIEMSAILFCVRKEQNRHTKCGTTRAFLMMLAMSHFHTKSFGLTNQCASHKYNSMLLQKEEEECRQHQDTVAPRRDERASSITSKLWAIAGSIVIVLMVTICLHPTTTRNAAAAIVKTATSDEHAVPLHVTGMLHPTTTTTTNATAAIVKTATSNDHAAVRMNVKDMSLRQKGGTKRFERRAISYRPSRYPNAKCARECSQAGAKKWR
jgi:hypothetical protein